MNTNCPSEPALKILAIDDEPTILMMLKRLLCAGGYEVTTASCGLDGLAAFREGQYDLVTVDRSMPDLNGEEVAAALKKLSPETPVILITGFPNAVRQVDLFHAVLGKPFHSTELFESIASALRKERNIPSTVLNN